MPDFMPKKYTKEPITIQVIREKRETIDCAAAGFHLSRSEFINQCIDYAMEHVYEREKKEK